MGFGSAHFAGSLRISVLAIFSVLAIPAHGQNTAGHATPPCPAFKSPTVTVEAGRPMVEVRVRMDVDVDGAPNAYGPPGVKALDINQHAYALPESGHSNEIVGYILQYPGGPPKLQGPHDPYPGYYISQTTFEDKDNPNEDDPRRYVDATRINYLVQGRVARRNGVKIGDFAVVYSCRTGKSAYAIVADSGNESGAEGSLALVRALGYTYIKDGIENSIDKPEIVVRYFPGSNPSKMFFKNQGDLDRAVEQIDPLK